MPLPSQFSLSLELANLAHLFPVRAGIAYTTESIITWARELKRTGSDFLVEEDLAVVFGRARIVPLLENHFRDVVKISSFVPLSGDSEIVLDAGPGPTLRRALKDARYMATVIQLSFLAWMHEETTLAAALTESMLTRYDQRVQNATSDPDYEGILGTLRACISQTSQFPWEMLMSLVESKFPKSVAWFHIIGSPLKILSPNLLLGAMDYLYLVQSLPEDRIIVVDNQMGLVPIVVWGYCILGLTVLVKGSPDGDVAFGREEGPQIIINWSREWEMHMWSWEAKNTSVPVISLLDGDMEVLLSTKPDDSETVEIEGQEIHRLEGYGTTFLRGLFNMDSIIADDHPIYAESVQHLIAFAIVMLKSTRRVPFPGVSDPRKQPEVPEQCYMKVENIRLIASSEALFSGITFDKKEINGYVEKLTGIELGNLPLPPTIRSHLDNGGKKDKRYNNHGVDGSLKILASMIITFAQVVDVRDCSQMPLMYNPQSLDFANALMWEGLRPINMNPDDSFISILSTMLGQSSMNVSAKRIFLFSHRGWSLFDSSVGDNDPGKVNCESLSIKSGVPTNTRTNERKFMMIDAPRIRPKGDTRWPVVMDRGNHYVPRCVSPIVKRTELYSSRAKEFWQSLRFDVDESGTPLRSREVAKFSYYASYKQLHNGSWGVVKTMPCSHPKNESGPLPLDMGVLTAKGFVWVEKKNEPEQRICIVLVKGDSRARWLVIAGLVIDDSGLDPHMYDELKRRVMLRCDSCCEDCAVKSASAMEGKWLVIL